MLADRRGVERFEVRRVAAEDHTVWRFQVLFLRCPFCHRLVLRPFYAGHKARHTAKKAGKSVSGKLK